MKSMPHFVHAVYRLSRDSISVNPRHRRGTYSIWRVSYHTQSRHKSNIKNVITKDDKNKHIVLQVSKSNRILIITKISFITTIFFI